MAEQSVETRYAELLEMHVSRPEEAHLAAIAELGRELVLANVPPESVVEIHEEAVLRLAKASPRMTLLEATLTTSSAMMEMLMAYGLAFRVRVEQLQREVTKRERTEDALKASESRLRAQYDGIPIPTYTWQKRGEEIVLVDYNMAASTITQGGIADFVECTANDVYRDRPDIQHDLARCLTERCSFEREMVYRFASTGETKHLAVKYAFVPPDLALVHTEDITERKRAEEQLEHLNQEKNRFLGMATHDLRSPLAVIRAYSEFLLEEIGERISEEQRQFLEIIESSSRFMSGLVNDLLDVSAIESGQLNLELVPTDLGELIRRNAVLNQSLSSQKQIEFQEDVGSLPTLIIDPNKIEQVMNNLLSNAIKYSPPGSVIAIRAKREGDQVRVSVSDQGPGIPEAERQKLFQPFGRTGVPTTGGEKSVGLGLMLVKKIVEAHNGQIDVESDLGSGSTFTYSLPIS